MKDYTDLVKSLRNCEDGVSCDLCLHWQDKLDCGENVCEGLLCREAADAIEELQAAQKWIPVTERVPEDRHDVLVYAGVLFPYITVGYYDGLWKFSFNDEEIAGSADYWMPLPEPPKEETE